MIVSSAHRHVSDVRQMVGNSWLITIDEEEWTECRPRGLALAVHVTLENLTAASLETPHFKLDSGALDADQARAADVASVLEDKIGLPGIAPPGQRIEGWLGAAFKYRYVGGYSGYRIVSDEIPGNWRGIERLIEEPPPGTPSRHVDARQIATELGIGLYRSADLLDMAQWTAEGYKRAGSDDAEIERALQNVTLDYQGWAQRETMFLRDRVGSDYEYQFSGTGERGTVFDRIERKRAVLERLVAEFQRAASQPDAGAGPPRDAAPSVDRDALSTRAELPAIADRAAQYVFRREGDHWRVVFEGKEAPLLDHRVGFETIAELLAQPHEPIPARTLMLPTAMRGGAQRSTPEDELRSDDLGVDVVDEPTLAQVRARLAEVERDLLLATDGGPSYKRLQEDRWQMRSYLRQVSNHRGKSRQIVDGRERARLAVGKRIRSAIETIGPELPALAAHLRQAIQLGYEPVYQPTAQIDWVLR